MKKLYFVIGILFLIIILSMQFTTTIFAETTKLDSAEVSVNKTKIAPGEEVNLIASFGKALGAYTVNVEYDKDVFDYVRSEGGEASNQNGKIIIAEMQTNGIGTKWKNNTYLLLFTRQR